MLKILGKLQKYINGDKTLINVSRSHVGTIYVSASNLKLIPRWGWWKIWKVWTTSAGLRSADCIFIRVRQPLSLLEKPVIRGPRDFSADAPRGLETTSPQLIS